MTGQLFEPTDLVRKGWAEFVASRPANVRAVAERFVPWQLYRLKTTGHRVTLESFSAHEDGSVTLKVNVTGQFNFVSFDRQVFGIKPDDLEPCDLPTPDEPTGTVLTYQEDIDAFVAAMRPHVKGRSDAS